LGVKLIGLHHSLRGPCCYATDLFCSLNQKLLWLSDTRQH